MSSLSNYCYSKNKKIVVRNCFYMMNKNPQEFKVSYNMSKMDIQKFICAFLHEYKMDAFGYYTTRDEYWAKYKTDLYFMLRIDEENQTIVLSVDSDPNRKIWSIIYYIKDMLKRYPAPNHFLNLLSFEKFIQF